MAIAIGTSKSIASTAEKHPSIQGMVTSAAYDPTTQLTFLGGTFKTVAPYSTKNFLVTNADNTISNECKNVSPLHGTRSVISDNAGGWIVGLAYNTGTAVRGNSYSTGLFHVRSDGSINSLFTPLLNGDASSLALSGDTVYVAGGFNAVNGVSRGYAAAISLSTGALLPFNPVFNQPVFKMEQHPNGTLYFGGAFTFATGVSRRYAAAFDSTGALTSWNPDLNNRCYAIAVTSYGVYIGGNFSTVGGTARVRFAATDATTGALLSAVCSANNLILAITPNSAGTSLFLGGSFTTIGGVARNYIASVAVGDTATLSSWYPALDNQVRAISATATNVYVCGTFYAVNGVSARKAAVAFDPSTAATNSWTPNIPDLYTSLTHSGTYGPNGYSVALYNGKVALVGDFVGSSIDAVTRTGIVAVKPDGSVSSFSPSITGNNVRVSALAVSGDTLYFAGAFTTVNGTTRTNAAAVSISTGSLTSWNPQPNGWSLKIAPNGSTVYIAGAFTTLNGVSRNGVAATDSSTGSLLSFNANIAMSSYTRVNSILLNGSSLYIGGQFDSVGGTLRMSVAKVDATTGAVDTNFNTLSTQQTQNLGAGCYYNGTFYPQNTQWFANSYDCMFTVYGQWYDSYTSTVTTHWARTYSGAPAVIIDMAISNGILYILGEISSQPSGSLARDSIAAIDASTGALQSWNPNSSYVAANSSSQNLGIPGKALVVTDDKVYVTFPIALTAASAISVLDKTTGSLVRSATTASSTLVNDSAIYGYGLHAVDNGVMLVSPRDSGRQGHVRIWDTRYNEFRN